MLPEMWPPVFGKGSCSNSRLVALVGEQCGRRRKFAGCVSRQRRMLVVHVIERRRGAVDVQVENVGTIVVPGEVVTQLHLDRLLEIAVGVEDAFFRTQGPGD